MKKNHYRLSIVLGSLLLVVCSARSINAQEPKGAKRSPVPGEERHRQPMQEPMPTYDKETVSRKTEVPVYELRCRGGENAFQIEDAGLRRDAKGTLSSGLKIYVLFLKFNESYRPAGAGGSGLAPGTCSWVDRVLYASEPKLIRFEVKSVKDKVVQPTAESDPRSPISSYLSDPRHYESFFVYQTDNGYFEATKHEHWDGRIDPSKTGVEVRPLNKRLVVKP